jgi:hypothetical protein
MAIIKNFPKKNKKINTDPKFLPYGECDCESELFRILLGPESDPTFYGFQCERCEMIVLMEDLENEEG